MLLGRLAETVRCRLRWFFRYFVKKSTFAMTSLEHRFKYMRKAMNIRHIYITLYHCDMRVRVRTLEQGSKRKERVSHSLYGIRELLYAIE